MPTRRNSLFCLFSAAVGAALLTGGAADAQPRPEIVKESLGEWLAVTDDGRPGCRLRLEAERTISGWVAVPAPDCAARHPRLADVSAWTLDNGIKLFDPTRKLVLHFEEDETTLLKTRAGTGPATLLVRAKPGVDRAPHAPSLFGAWAMRRPDGQSLCEITLLDSPPPGGEESFGLRTSAACDAAVKRLKLASWRVEDFAVMLYGEDGASLRFEPGPDGFEKAASEGGRPLQLVRLRRSGPR